MQNHVTRKNEILQKRQKTLKDAKIEIIRISRALFKHRLWRKHKFYGNVVNFAKYVAYIVLLELV